MLNAQPFTKCYRYIYKNPENPVSLVSVDGVQWGLLWETIGDHCNPYAAAPTVGSCQWECDT